MLTSLGYQVVGVCAPNEALEIFRQAPSHFDLVITDLTMPGITGDKLAERLRAIRPNLPILLCSGYMRQLGSHPCLDGHIQKPFRLQDLSRIVREALDS